MTAITLESIATTRKLLASRELSAEELVLAHLERIDAAEDQVRAWVHVDAAGALEAARSITASDDRPLAGIPIGVKDIFDVAGMPTTASSRILAGRTARGDAQLVARMRASGAVVVGKTNTHEFAYGFVSPPTSNPWDLGRIPGGSSGGSAAALAAGHVRAALGSDTGGSIRVPASLCGVAGLKPRHGVLMTDGMVPLAPSLDCPGPMSRTAADLGLVWQALTGRAPSPSGKIRVGFVPPEEIEDLEPGVGATYSGALKVLEAVAEEMRPADVPPFEEFDRPRAFVLMPEILAVHRSRGWWPAHRDEYTEETRANLEYTERMTAEAIESGRAEARRLAGRLLRALDSAEVLAVPTALCTAPTHEEASVLDGGIRSPAARRLGRLTAPFNLAGLAAVSVVCGYPGGLPAGLQLAGRDEEMLLGLAASFESAAAIEPPT